MFHTDGVIYVLKAKIADRDHLTRIANTRAEFMKFGGTVIEHPTVEEFPNSRRSMLELIAWCSRRRPDDPLIAVSTWEELRNLKVAQALIRGGLTVVVADECRVFRLANTENPNAVYWNDLTEHALQISKKLRAYVDAIQSGSKGAVNNLARVSVNVSITR